MTSQGDAFIRGVQTALEMIRKGPPPPTSMSAAEAVQAKGDEIEAYLSSNFGVRRNG
jgi:hypothetical protein